MRGNSVGELSGLVDGGDRGQDLLRDLFVEFRVPLQPVNDAAHHRFEFGGNGNGEIDLLVSGRYIVFHDVELGKLYSFLPLNENLNGSIGQPQHLEDRGMGTNSMDLIRLRIIDLGIFLGHQKDVLIRCHGLFQSPDGFVPAHE